MQIIVLDPSPLVRNVMRVLTRTVWPGVPCLECDSLESLQQLEPADSVTAMLIGDAALDNDPQEVAANLTQDQRWAAVPKIITTRTATERWHFDWRAFSHTTLLPRPYTPEDFQHCVRSCTDAA